MRIIQAQRDDAPAIIDLQRLAYQSEAEIYNDWQLPALTQTVESLKAEFSNSVILKAMINGELAGSVRGSLNAGACAIGRLIVHPAHQRKGVGSHLLREIEQRFSHCEKYVLFTGSKSVGNIRLYERHGYQKTHERLLSEKVTLVFLEKPN